MADFQVHELEGTRFVEIHDILGVLNDQSSELEEVMRKDLQKIVRCGDD